jgi:hypothetical protein
MDERQTLIGRNGELGERLTEAALLKHFFVLKRSFDGGGADFLVQECSAASINLPNGALTVGIVQAKFFQGSNQVKIARSYVLDVDGPRPNFFAFLHTMDAKSVDSNFVFSGDEISREWGVSSCGQYYTFSLSRNRRFERYRNRSPDAVKNLILDGIHQARSHHRQFVLGRFFETHVDVRVTDPTPHPVTYLLRVVEGSHVVLWRDEVSRGTRPLEPRRDLFNYAGDFYWGYGGTGPMFLTMSILGHYLGRNGVPTNEQRLNLLSALGEIPKASNMDIPSNTLERILCGDIHALNPTRSNEFGPPLPEPKLEDFFSPGLILQEDRRTTP